MTEKELKALADEIEESDGLLVMSPIGPIQIGIKKTSLVIAAIRAASALRALAELPPRATMPKLVSCKKCRGSDPHCSECDGMGELPSSSVTSKESQ